MVSLTNSNTTNSATTEIGNHVPDMQLENFSFTRETLKNIRLTSINSPVEYKSPKQKIATLRSSVQHTATKSIHYIGKSISSRQGLKDARNDVKNSTIQSCKGIWRRYKTGSVVALSHIAGVTGCTLPLFLPNISELPIINKIPFIGNLRTFSEVFTAIPAGASAAQVTEQLTSQSVEVALNAYAIYFPLYGLVMLSNYVKSKITHEKKKETQTDTENDKEKNFSTRYLFGTAFNIVTNRLSEMPLLALAIVCQTQCAQYLYNNYGDTITPFTLGVVAYFAGHLPEDIYMLAIAPFLYNANREAGNHFEENMKSDIIELGISNQTFADKVSPSMAATTIDNIEKLVDHVFSGVRKLKRFLFKLPSDTTIDS